MEQHKLQNVPISQPQNTQTFIDKGKVELSMKIPRPKRSYPAHCSKHSSQSEISNGLAYQPHLNGGNIGHHSLQNHNGQNHNFRPRSSEHSSHLRSPCELRSKSRSRSVSKDSSSSAHHSGRGHHRHKSSIRNHHNSSNGVKKSSSTGDSHSLKFHQVYTNRAFQDWLFT